MKEKVRFIIDRVRLIILNFLFKPFRKGNITYTFFSQGIENIKADSKFSVPRNSFFSGDIKIGKYSTIGESCFLRGDIEIKNYTQLGAYVSIHSRNHPINTLSTYQGKQLFNGALKELRSDRKVTIGNDVWIGHGTIILSGVTIGDGAIVGGGSVVTKDIPSFAIAAGAPAKVMSYRFDESTRNRIRLMNWWVKNPDELSKMKKSFYERY